MPAGKHNLTTKRGESFAKTLTRSIDGTPFNLTSCTARMQVRTDWDTTTALLTLTSTSGLTLGGALGTIAIAITDEQSWTLAAGKYVYDVFVYPADGTAIPWLEGTFIVQPTATRPTGT